MKLDGTVPTIRVRDVNGDAVADAGDYVLYWMVAARRPGWNFALQRAVDWAAELGKPLLVFEPLRLGYGWASARLHRFVIDGMIDNRAAFADSPVAYLPFIEEQEGEGRGLLEALAGRAAVVVTDEYPAFFLPRMIAAAGKKLPVRLEAVDSNGLLPMAATERVFKTAYSFRRFLQQELPDHWEDLPRPRPHDELEDAGDARDIAMDAAPSWTFAEARLDADDPLDSLSFSTDVAVVEPETGGYRRAEAKLRNFLDERVGAYADQRGRPLDEATSELSAHLHFGHLSAQRVFAALMEREDWSPDDVAAEAKGKRSGWWGVGEGAESFLDQLVTWRELGFNLCWHRDDYDEYDSLPDWAIETLEEHRADERPDLYTLEELERAETHDPIWNAAQRQLVRDGHIYNYVRMLWGKKILEWSPSPRDALDVMVELNNKYALDGRDPNSYSGIFWILGRYDRAWGPERPIFGKIRYMSSDSTRRKFPLDGYLDRYAAESESDEASAADDAGSADDAGGADDGAAGSDAS